MDSLDPRLVNAAIALGVIGLGVGLVVWLVRRLSAQEETKGERLIQKALGKGNRIGAAKIAFDHGQYERSGRLYLDADRVADAARAYKRAELWAKAPESLLPKSAAAKATGLAKTASTKSATAEARLAKSASSAPANGKSRPFAGHHQHMRTVGHFHQVLTFQIPQLHFQRRFFTGA